MIPTLLAALCPIVLAAFVWMWILWLNEKAKKNWSITDVPSLREIQASLNKRSLGMRVVKWERSWDFPLPIVYIYMPEHHWTRLDLESLEKQP